MKKTTILVVLACMLSTFAFSQVGIGTTTPAPDAVLELASTTKALLVTRVANTAAVTAPVNGMIIYDISSDCFKRYENSAWTECNATTIPVIATLDCAGAVADGTLTSGTAASGVTVTVPYTGGNGGTYNGQIVASTGVTGLSATLFGGTLATGAATIIYTITGTPNGSGTASFAVNFLGQSCTITVTVQATPPPQVLTLDCASAALDGTLTANTFAGGTFVSFGYTGGNGIAYSAQSIESTGVLGINANLSSGTLANGNGTLIFALTGTPTSGGTASFALTLGGQSCSFTVNVTALPSVDTWSNCSSATAGTLVQGVAASGVTQTAAYTGGNGENYPGFSVASTGVLGLSANLAAGNLANGNGSVIFTITGTPTSSGTATFNLTLFGASCSFSRTVDPPTISGITCGSAAFSPTTITLNSAYTGTMTVPYTGGNAAPYPAGSAINSTGVTGLTATLQAGTLSNNAGGTLTYTISGTPSSTGPTSALFALSFTGATGCTVTKAIIIPAPVVTTLVCGSPVFTPATITQGTAYSGNFTITYTGGNNVPYPAGSVINSTGVSGLTATLQAGTLSNNAGGTLTFTVGGTPTSGGTASFPISFGGQTCTVTKAVVALPSITGLTCASTTYSPSTFTALVSYTGTATVPYTGGDSSAYSAGAGIPSTGVTGLTATLQAGTLTPNGNLIYNITGIPSGNGVASFAISFAGFNCTLKLTSCGAYISATVFKVFGCYNLGAYATTDPHVPVRGTNGSYYQWGRSAPAATVTTTTDALIGTWGSQGGTSDNGRWTSTAGGGPGNPCPSGFRVPSITEWDGVTNASFNTVSRTLPFTSSSTNFGAAIHYGPSVSVKTLTLPAAGFRFYTNGTLDYRGNLGYYWSSTENSTNAWFLYFDSSSAYTTLANRTNGFSVRCVSE